MRIRTIHSVLVLASFAISTPIVLAQFIIPKIKVPKTPAPASTQQSPSTQPSVPAANSNAAAASRASNGSTTVSSATEPTINKPSVQITLRTVREYYRNGVRDQETWSWTPHIVYRVNGPISAGGQLSAEFTLPSGKSWIKVDCSTHETKPGYWWETECGSTGGDLDSSGSIETGVAAFKIILKNELEGTNKTLFSGKFKVDKFHVGVVDLPKFKNNFSYYVNYDWNLPIGYIYGSDPMDLRVGNRPSSTEERLSFVTWFKGDPKVLDFGKFVAYLYYQGKMVADSTGGDKYGASGCQVTNAASEESPNTYCRHYFTVNATVWDKQPEYHPNDFPMYKNPGDYEIKILENGKLARTAKFTMGSDGNLVDTGIGPQSNLGTGRIVIPVQVIGDQDGAWDKSGMEDRCILRKSANRIFRSMI